MENCSEISEPKRLQGRSFGDFLKLGLATQGHAQGNGFDAQLLSQLLQAFPILHMGVSENRNEVELSRLVSGPAAAGYAPSMIK